MNGAIPGWDGFEIGNASLCPGAKESYDYRENGLVAPRLVLGGGTGGAASVVTAVRPSGEELEAALGAGEAGDPAGLEGACPGGLRSTGLDISVPGTKLRR